MKKFLALILSLLIFLCSCTTNTTRNKELENNKTDIEENFNFTDSDSLEEIENNVYSQLIDQLSEEYIIDNVSLKYISQEYIDELSYNSQSNIYFGYTLSELYEQFNGTKFIFTLGDDGKTIVKEVDKYDDTYEKVLKNFAIGTGVILCCVKVSSLTTVSAPALSVILLSSAKYGTITALSDGAFSAVLNGLITGFETKDFDKAIKSAVLNGSEDFKYGAILGSIGGGISKLKELNVGSLKGLKLNEVAKIQRESKYPIEIIKRISSYDEYNVYKNIKLKPVKVNDKYVLAPKIDWKTKDVKDMTNKVRCLSGSPPVDKNGVSYEIHHIGQNNDSPFAILTKEQHNKFYSKLHKNTGAYKSEINRDSFVTEKKKFWKSFCEQQVGIQ